VTLQSSGPLKASELQTEFGGSNPFRLSDYYAGGANVPAGTVGDGGPIPTSGTIKFSDFYGASNLLEDAKTLTVGVFTDTRGYVNGGFGALAPDSLLKTIQINAISARLGSIDIRIAGITLAQDFWTRLEITGGPTLLSENAVFTEEGGTQMQWRFTDAFAFPNSSYPISFFYFP
jgi:hypothetical protein